MGLPVILPVSHSRNYGASGIGSVLVPYWLSLKHNEMTCKCLLVGVVGVVVGVGVLVGVLVGVGVLCLLGFDVCVRLVLWFGSSGLR